MDSKSTVKLKPGVEMRPGQLIVTPEIKEDYDKFLGFAPHVHCFDSALGYVIGTSMWWRYQGQEMKQSTNIRGIFCSCGSLLMFDEDK